MSSTDPIVVVGASAGGFEALKTLIGGLPADFPAPVFVVWHMSPDIRGVMPDVLNRFQTLYATHARDGEKIEPGRVYIAPPDRHLLVENSHVRLTRGPKENRFRPAVDPLFRSAAYHYGPNVIGIILSGALDDGTSGLWMVKHRGGTTIVQHPVDAEVPSMPENALREVIVDHVVSVAEMPGLLIRLIENRREEPGETDHQFDEKENRIAEAEIGIAAEENALERGVMDMGELSPYTCPDCHGVLSSILEGNRKRFRCHTGHAFSADSLLTTVTENIEQSLWDAVRGIEESIIMLNHMGDHFSEVNEPRLAAMYFQKANEAAGRADKIREALFSHEQLSKETIKQEANEVEEAVTGTRA